MTILTSTKGVPWGTGFKASWQGWGPQVPKGLVFHGLRKSAVKGGTLIEAVSARQFATPTARDWRSGKASQATHDKNSRPLSEQVGGMLNPPFVEWLMGYPLGWTDLDASATVSSRKSRK